MESGYYVQNSEASLNFNVPVVPDEKEDEAAEDEKEQQHEIEMHLLHEFNDLIDDGADDCNSSFSSKNEDEKYSSSRWSNERWFENVGSPSTPVENGQGILTNLSMEEHDSYSESNNTTPQLFDEDQLQQSLPADYGILHSAPGSNNSYDDPNIDISDRSIGLVNGIYATDHQIYLAQDQMSTGGLNPNAVPFSTYTEGGKQIKSRQLYNSPAQPNFEVHYAHAGPEWVNGHYDYGRDYMGADPNSSAVQLRILYDARGRELEKLKNDLEEVEENHKQNEQNLVDQLEAMKDDNEALKSELIELTDYKNLVAEKDGKIIALNSRIANQDECKIELTKQLQVAESTIESLNEQIAELERTDAITRSRAHHELILANMQKKHEEESQKMKENMDALCAQLQAKTEEVQNAQRKLTEMSQNLASRTETINHLTKSLEESQLQCQNFLKGGKSSENQHDASVSDKLISSLQEEIVILKEELEMYESANNVINNAQSYANDTIGQLNVKKSLSWKSPGTPGNGSSSNDLVSNLKRELERCVSSNRNKRSKLTKLQSDYRNNLRELELVKSQLAALEKQKATQQSKIANLQSKLNDLNPLGKEQAIINIHDVDKLKIEREQLMEELEEVKKRLNESTVNERQLDQAVRQLHQQMTQLVHDSNEDRRQALERSQQTYLQLHEDSIKKVRKEMSQKHKEELSRLQDKLQASLDELDSVKQIYVNVCQEKNQIEKELDEVKAKSEESEKNLKEIENIWQTKLRELHLTYEQKTEEAVSQLKTKKSLQWQQSLDAVQAEKEKETMQKIMDITQRLEIEKEEAINKLEERKNKEFLREMKKVNEKANKDTQEAIRAIKQKMNNEKDKLIELLENGWKQNKMMEIKDLEEKHQFELQQLTDKLIQEKLLELKQFDEKRDKERKKLVQHIVLKKNKEKHEQLKQLEERLGKQHEEELNRLVKSKHEDIERLEKDRDCIIDEFNERFAKLKLEHEENIKTLHEKSKRDKEMLFNLVEDARRKELKDMQERDKTEISNQMKARVAQEQQESEKKNALFQMESRYQKQLEAIREDNERLKEELKSLQVKLNAKNHELDDLKLQCIDKHKEVRDALKLLERQKGAKENDDSLKTTKDSSDDERLDLDCLKSLQEQNADLLKMYKAAKEEFEREKAEIQLQHNRAVTLLKEKHLHTVKSLRKDQISHQLPPVVEDENHACSLQNQVSKLEAELRVHQAKVRELETQMKIKNGQLETFEHEQNIGMKQIEVQMQSMLQELQSKLQQKQIEMDREKQEHEREMKDIHQKLAENALQDSETDKVRENVGQVKKSEEVLEKRVHELELGLENKKAQVQLVTIKANQEIERLKNELEKAHREKELTKSPIGNRHVTDKGQQERTQLKAKLRQCQKFAQNREVQHQMAMVKLQQDHKAVVKELESKMDILKKTSLDSNIQDIAKVHRAQVKALKEQYSAELNAVHQQYARELETVQGLVQHYQTMYKQLVDSDSENLLEIQDSIKQVVGALQKDLFQYLNGLNKRVAQRIHTEVMKERRMIVARLKEQFGIKESKELELSILHSEIEAQLHVEPTVDSWATVSHSEGFLSTSAECDRITSRLEFKGDKIDQNDHLSKLLKQMGLHGSASESFKGQKLEASCLRYKTPTVDKLAHGIVPLRSAFSVDHIHNPTLRKEDAEKKPIGLSGTEKKSHNTHSHNASTPATREQPIGQSASETIVSKSSKQPGKKNSPRSNRTTVGNALDSVQTLAKKQGDDLEEMLEDLKMPQNSEQKLKIDKGIQKVIEANPEILNALLESFQSHVKDKNYINKVCHCRTGNENQQKVGDSYASKTFVPLETESDSSVSVKGWSANVNEADKGYRQQDQGKRQWVRKSTTVNK